MCWEGCEWSDVVAVAWCGVMCMMGGAWSEVMWWEGLV